MVLVRPMPQHSSRTAKMAGTSGTCGEPKAYYLFIGVSVNGTGHGLIGRHKAGRYPASTEFCSSLTWHCAESSFTPFSTSERVVGISRASLRPHLWRLVPGVCAHTPTSPTTVSERCGDINGCHSSRPWVMQRGESGYLEEFFLGPRTPERKILQPRSVDTAAAAVAIAQ